jgi:hypothetical protein
LNLRPLDPQSCFWGARPCIGVCFHRSPPCMHIGAPLRTVANWRNNWRTQSVCWRRACSATFPGRGFQSLPPLVTVVALALAGVRSDPGGISTAPRGAQPLRGGAAGNRTRCKRQLTCGNADSDDAKQRETTCDYAKGPTIDAMPLQIHTQPDPDHFCETCGGPSELISQTITPWDGNETMAREVSPWTPRCADPWCQSRRPRHRR